MDVAARCGVAENTRINSCSGLQGPAAGLVSYLGCGHGHSKIALVVPCIGAESV
jgi:hypothetical protein